MEVVFSIVQTKQKQNRATDSNARTCLWWCLRRRPSSLCCPLFELCLSLWRRRIRSSRNMFLHFKICKVAFLSSLSFDSQCFISAFFFLEPADSTTIHLSSSQSVFPNTSHLLYAVQRICWILYFLVLHYFRGSLERNQGQSLCLILCTLQVRGQVKRSADLVNRKLRHRVFIFVHLCSPANLLPPLPRCPLEHAGLSWRKQVSDQLSKQVGYYQVISLSF